jgi:hypothetical protein
VADWLLILLLQLGVSAIGGLLGWLAARWVTSDRAVWPSGVVARDHQETAG